MNTSEPLNMVIVAFIAFFTSIFFFGAADALYLVQTPWLLTIPKVALSVLFYVASFSLAAYGFEVARALVGIVRDELREPPE
jgi:hypothetical protein